LNQDENTYDLIDQYLQGDLAEDHPFIQLIKDDEELALEVEVRRLIPDAVVDYRLMEVEKLVAKKRAEFLGQDAFKWKKLFWALPVLLAGMIAYFSLPDTKNIGVVPNEKVTQRELLLIPQNAHEVQVETVQKENTLIEPTKIEKAKEVIGSKEEIKNEPIIVIEENPYVSFEEKKELPVVNSEKTESVLAKNESVATIANPCVGIRIKAYVEEGRPCIGAEDGYLNLKDVRGGKAPYQFSINKQRFQEDSKFAGLKSGEFDVFVKDANDCETVVYEKYSLKSKNCSQIAEHVFNPQVGTWEVPNKMDKAGELDIFDKDGQRIFFKHFVKSENITWSGTANSGELLLPGVYIYRINYSDGVVEQGRITITY
jgi:hypothetical protein